MLPDPPVCEQVGWTRVNHLGNSQEGVPLNFTWRLPYFPSGNDKIAVLRIRYMYMYIHNTQIIHVYGYIHMYIIHVHFISRHLMSFSFL